MFYVFGACILGAILIYVKCDYVRASKFATYLLSINRSGGISKIRRIVYLSQVAKKVRPFVEEVIGYLIGICVAFISFYSAYLLALKKANNETKANAINLFEYSCAKSAEVELFLRKYGAFDTAQSLRGLNIDSTIVSTFCTESVHKPVYITEAIAPFEVLSYLTNFGYEVMSRLDENEQNAFKIVEDTSESYRNRRKTLNAAFKFDSLRIVISNEEKDYLKGKINEKNLALMEDSINDFNTQYIKGLTPQNYSIYYRDKPPVDSNSLSLKEMADSLKKYSYLLIGNSGDKFRTGTCFFLRKNSNLYVVSTYDVFTSWNVMDKKKSGSRILPQIDTLSVRVIRRINGNSILIKIAVKRLADTSKMRHFWEKPDLFVYKLKDRTLDFFYRIYSIENLIDRYSIDNGTPENVFLAGATSSDVLQLGMRRASVIGYICKMLRDINYRPYYQQLGQWDSLNYIIDYFPPEGVDGAPVFFKVSIPVGIQNIDIATFGGVFFGSTGEKSGGRVVRPEELKKIYKNLK